MKKLVLMLMFYACISGTPARAVIGELDRNGKFPFVLRMHSDTSSCSAVLVGPYYLMTAAHCVYNRETGFDKHPVVEAPDGREIPLNPLIPKAYAEAAAARVGETFSDWLKQSRLT